MQSNPLAIIIGCYTGWYVYKRKMYGALILQFVAILISVVQPLYELITIGHMSPSDYLNNGFALAGFLVVLCLFSRIKFKNKVKNLWGKYPNAARSVTYKTDFGKCETSDLLKLIDYDEEYYAQLEVKILCEAIQKKYPLGFAKYKNSLRHTEQDCIKDESEIQRLQSDISNYYRLKQKYPYAIQVYSQKYRNSSVIESVLSSIPEEKYQILEKLHKKVCEFNLWEKKQDEFTKDSRHATLDDWGCYCYELKFEKPDEDGTTKKGHFLLWQHFEESYCDNMDLDYSYYPSAKKHYEELSGLKDCSLYFNDFVYDKLLGFIKHIKEKYDNLIVVFGDSNLSEDKVDSFNDYHFEYLKEQLSQNEIAYYGAISSIGSLTEKFLPIVVVEMISTNAHIKEQCQCLMEMNFHPCITYISLEKGFDTEEMTRRIVKEKHKAQEVEEENRRKERERLEAQERKHNALTSLRRCVSSWETLAYDLPYNYLLYYYPTTCDFEATEDEWDDRWLVWNFKNTPGRTSEEEHEEALDEVIPTLTSLLEDTFGKYLDMLTLVCIPASSEANNNARFEDFSERLANETSMDNAFDHIQVVKDATPKHLGGTGTPVLHFDEDYFNGRYILLFDDVITKGNSMLRFKRKLEALGATVIAGVSIGKTTHER